MRLHIFRFRPSSHSEDITLIARYADPADADKAYDALKRLLKDMEENIDEYEVDWSSDEAGVELWDKHTVVFNVYTAGYLEDVEAVLRRFKSLQKIDAYTNYQEVVITVKLPATSKEAAALILEPEELNAIRWLEQHCKCEQEKLKDGNLALKFYYAGDQIYDECANTLHLGSGVLDLDEHKNWEVEVLVGNE